ncbi:hypothetical protein ACNOYE_09485 [Nannocystaceae bacterium ST9]
MAPRVWGGPPEPAPAPAPTDEAGLPAADVESGEAKPEALAEQPDAELLGESSNEAGIPDAITLRTQMEEGMAMIGELAVEARAEADLVRATCVLDKQDRANDVMELGTGELLVIRDSTTSEQSRQFAVEKLDAAAGRIDKLVEEAKACAGQQGPEDKIDITRTDAEEPRTIPIWDPTAGLGSSPVPPPVDGGWPPAASPIE